MKKTISQIILWMMVWNFTSTSAQVTYNLPDNFYNSTCNYVAENFNFSIALRYESTVTIDNYCAMATGDLDADGNAEIVAMMPNNNTHHAAGSYLTNGFYIFNHDATVRKTVNFPGGYIFSTYVNSITLADLDNDGKGEIVFSTVGVAGGIDYRLYVYDYNGNLKTNIASDTYFLNTTGVTDFNGDGYPEIYSGTNIYRYQGGSLIQLYKGNASQFSIAQDIDKDGVPEIVTQDNTFKVNLTNMSGMAGNTVTQLTANPVTGNGTVHALSDVDLDGNIEVISVQGGTGVMTLRVWNPVTGATKYSKTVSTPCNTGGSQSSFPFIGDTDNDGYPDIAFMGGSPVVGCTSVYRYEYDAGVGDVVFRSSDNSFEDYSSRITGLSMFDFNIDGNMEVVYRDQICLYILRGNNFTKEITVPNNMSGTLREYPLIASLTSSGESFILINSGVTVSQVGTLRIYGADVNNNGTPWAPARKLWNQFAFYQNTMNDNLQVISNPAPLNLLLTSTDGLNKKMRPFNGAQFQLGPIESKSLEFVHPIADVGVTQLGYDYDVAANKLNFNITLNNTGEASMDPVIPVNIYAYNGGVATKISTYNITEAINVGDLKSFAFSINNFSSFIPHDSLVIKVAEGKLDCNPSDNKLKINTHYVDNNCDDYYGMFNDGTGAKGTFNILANDQATYPGINDISSFTSSAGSSLVKQAGTPPLLKYTSAGNFLGTDTILYSSKGINSSNEYLLVSAKAYVYAYPNRSRMCEGDYLKYDIRINDVKNDVTVDWSYSASGIFNDANNLSGVSTASYNLYAQVLFKVSGATVAAFNNRIPTSYTIEVVPPLMYWSVNANNSNWNDPVNWVNSAGQALNVVPLACTDVHISGKSGYYPSLDSATTVRSFYYSDPECRDITYHYGAEVAKPHYLSYRKAYIRYSFGYFYLSTYLTDGDLLSAPPMKRGRWYMLSAPLKKMVTGDLSVGGYPNMWQRTFRTSPDQTPGHLSDLVGDWYVPENNNALELGAKQNYSVAIWAGEYLPVAGENDHAKLNQLKGIFEIPYFENASISSLHRIHNYNASTHTSSFNYYYNIPGLPIEPAVAPGTIVRDQEAYRFVIEDANNKPQKDFKVTVAAGDEVIVGNVFLSSLDFKDFYNRNSSVISNYYRLFTDNAWDTYDILSGSLTLTQYIAPYQSFVVRTLGTKGSTVDLHFPISSSVTRPIGTGHQLRSSGKSELPENVLYIEAEGANHQSWATVCVNAYTEKNNILKMFTRDEPNKNLLQLYTLDKNNRKNTVQCEVGDEIDIPFGLVCDSVTDLKLTIRNIENLNARSLTLFDTKHQRSYNLLEKGMENNKFIYEPEDGARFRLRINQINSPAGVDLVSKKSPDAFVIDKVLHVHASQEISEVEVMTVQGMKVHSAVHLRETSYVKELPIPTGIYIVSVKTADGKMHVVKILVNSH